jgi:hypothetical protein
VDLNTSCRAAWQVVLADELPADAHQVVDELVLYVALFGDAGHNLSGLSLLGILKTQKNLRSRSNLSFQSIVGMGVGEGVTVGVLVDVDVGDRVGVGVYVTVGVCVGV